MARARGRAEPDEVERRIDALLAADPREFTAGRDALARELSAARDARAREVKALRRPTVVAAALNRLARERGGDLARLVAAGEALRAAHAAALRGQGGAGLREADAAMAAALAPLVADAERALAAAGHAGGPAVLGRLRAALRGEAAAGGERAAALLRGRYVREPEPAADDAMAAMAEMVKGVARGAGGARHRGRAPLPGPALARRGEVERGTSNATPPPPRTRPPSAAAARAAARKAAREAAAERKRVDRERAAAARALAAAEREEQRRERDVAEAERRAIAARNALDTARAALADARGRVEEARGAVAAVPRFADGQGEGGRQ